MGVVCGSYRWSGDDGGVGERLLVTRSSHIGPAGSVVGSRWKRMADRRLRKRLVEVDGGESCKSRERWRHGRSRTTIATDSCG